MTEESRGEIFRVQPHRKRAAIINSTGEVSPRRQQLVLHEGERLASEEEKTAFWTEQRLEVAKRVFEGCGKELQSMFGPEQIKEVKSFDSENVELIVVDDPDRHTHDYAGVLNHDGRIGIYIRGNENEKEFAALIAHETGHFYSLRMSEEIYPGGKVETYRQGLRNKLGRAREDFLGSEDSFIGFSVIDEAIIEKTMMEVLHKVAPDLKVDADPTTYYWCIELTSVLCETLAWYDKSLASMDDAYRLVQNAVFGKGNATELFKSIIKVYGSGSLRALAALSGGYGGGVGDGSLANEVNHSRFLQLADHINKPAFDRSMKSATADVNYTKQEMVVGGKHLKIDLSKVDRRVPVKKWYGRSGLRPVVFDGVESRVSGFIASVNRLLDRSESVEVSPEIYSDIFATTEVPYSLMINSVADPNLGNGVAQTLKQVEESAYRVISAALGESKDAEFVLESGGQKTEFRRAKAGARPSFLSGQNKKELYIVHITDENKAELIYPAYMTKEEITKVGARKI